MHESGQFSKIQLNWTLAEFSQYVCQSYPQVSLNLVGFELARTDRGKKLKKVQVASVRELKTAIGKSRLYIIPLAEIFQVCKRVCIYIYIYIYTTPNQKKLGQYGKRK